MIRVSAIYGAVLGAILMLAGAAFAWYVYVERISVRDAIERIRVDDGSSQQD